MNPVTGGIERIKSMPYFTYLLMLAVYRKLEAINAPA